MAGTVIAYPAPPSGCIGLGISLKTQTIPGFRQSVNPFGASPRAGRRPAGLACGRRGAAAPAGFLRERRRPPGGLLLPLCGNSPPVRRERGPAAAGEFFRRVPLPAEERFQLRRKAFSARIPAVRVAPAVGVAPAVRVAPLAAPRLQARSAILEQYGKATFRYGESPDIVRAFLFSGRVYAACFMVRIPA